ncbi:hypothetical protein CORC01_02556 [Colletotrichum orchidophilum]|uniref:Heterokaryon incompatibility domain-containing protein n=1 Tax=Colletotrichum orchidophilum TaxID=1209926 RepID=A0A1G4BLU3_9PEZI|nr:uncharacterized protein CORC01_02556 [Colletotrichum orchidophilum]OHF02276.1 hypothetical protein CORC01_02556 [Colletotrichum orchidophilum]
MPATGVQARPDADPDRPPCNVCFDLDMARMPESIRSDERACELKDIIKASKKGCQPCYAIKVALQRVNGVNCHDSSLLLDTAFVVIYFSATVRIEGFFQYRNSENKVTALRTTVELFTKPGKPLPWKSITAYNEIPLKLHSKHRQKTIRGWVNDCNATHASCGASLYPLERHSAPRRYLDLGKTPRNGVKLVDFRSASEPYITVVHGCTGLLPAPSSPTTSENLERRRKCLHWWQIPVALQETLTIASELGIQYIWIHDFCVVQDAEEDMNWHLDREDLIFGRSYLTIALTDIQDLRLSNFGPARKAITEMSDNVDHGTGSVAIQVSKFGRTYHIHAREGMYWSHFIFAKRSLLKPMGFEVEESATMERHLGLFQHGPAFQRLLLSRRLLYLHRSELVWDCLEQPRCECDDKFYFGQSKPGLTKHIWMSRGAVNSPDHVLDLYKDMTTPNPDERLAVVASLFRHISRLYGRTHCAGMVSNSGVKLAADLLWTIRSMEDLLSDRPTRNSAPAPEAYRHHTDRIPSWSWASMVLSKGTTFRRASFLSPGRKLDSFTCSPPFSLAGGSYCDTLPGSRDDGLLATKYRLKVIGATRTVTVVGPKRSCHTPHLLNCYTQEVPNHNSSILFSFQPDCARLLASFRVQEMASQKFTILLLGVMGVVEGPSEPGCTSELAHHLEVGLVLRESPRAQGFERVGAFALPASHGIFASAEVRELVLV